MEKKKILLFIGTVLVFLICFNVINIKYDRLARYPYDDEYARRVIDEKLNNSEIEFLIEYSISPDYFMDYINCKKFNIYHIELYRKTENNYWFLSNEEIVSFSEKIINKFDDKDFSNLDSLMKKYSYDELNFYLNYLSNLKLIDDPSLVDIVLDEFSTISNYSPENLITYENITLQKRAYDKFIELLNTINEKYSCDDFGGIKVKCSYLSYDDLKELHDTGVNALPGSNIHQTGLCFDLDFSDSTFNTNKQEFITLAKEFGFILEECNINENHFRFIGVDDD